MSHISTLQLLQLADSALPIGTSAHSFGLETLAAEGDLTPTNIVPFFKKFMTETGPLEAGYCRRAYRLTQIHTVEDLAENWSEFEQKWCALNQALSARKPARENRTASTTLGARFLRLVAGLEPLTIFEKALVSQRTAVPITHYCTAVGLTASALGIGEEIIVAAYLQQSLTGLLSACQSLMPIGQMQAMSVNWQLKPCLDQIACQSQQYVTNEIYTFTPFLDVASMRHANLPVRLFIS